MSHMEITDDNDRKIYIMTPSSLRWKRRKGDAMKMSRFFNYFFGLVFCIILIVSGIDVARFSAMPIVVYADQVSDVEEAAESDENSDANEAEEDSEDTDDADSDSGDDDKELC